MKTSRFIHAVRLGLSLLLVGAGILAGTSVSHGQTPAAVVVDPTWGADMSQLDESTIAVTYYVSKTGSDSNAGTSPSTALRYINAGLTKAVTSINNGNPTKLIIMNDGTAWTDNAKRVIDPSGSGNNTLLVIEGQLYNNNKVILRSPAATEQSWYIKPPKRNLVIRNFIFEANPVKAMIGTEAGYPYVADFQNWLIEDCEFRDVGSSNADNTAFGLGEITKLTFRRVKSYNNYGGGGKIICRKSVIEDCQFYGNGITDGNRGGLFLWADDTRVSRIDVYSNHGTGMRNDIVGRNVLIEDSTFNDNGESGMKWEIALGPVLIRNCEIIDNGDEAANAIKNGNGLYLENVRDFTIENCYIQDNFKSQVAITGKTRDVLWPEDGFTNGGGGTMADGVGSLYPYQVAIYNTVRTAFNNNTITTTKGTSSYIYTKDSASTSWDRYETWYTDQFTGSGNTYYNNANTVVFEKRGSGSNTAPDWIRAFADLAAWKTLTGSDATSVWSPPVTTIPQSFEAEDLSRTTSGPSSTVDNDAGASGGQRVTFNGNGVDQWITYTANVTNPGYYNLKVIYKKLTAGGTAQLSVNGTNVGSPINTYAGTASFAEVTFNSVHFPTAGNHTFRFTITGKASAATGYKISVDRFDLNP